ncbi:MAG: hypothetical protein HQM08_30915 [Candidatus Riflebacteria bacterium]|nr:hypothetical protein [Candidatus Riflebacteria bacterium]
MFKKAFAVALLLVSFAGSAFALSNPFKIWDVKATVNVLDMTVDPTTKKVDKITVEITNIIGDEDLSVVGQPNAIISPELQARAEMISYLMHDAYQIVLNNYCSDEKTEILNVLNSIHITPSGKVTIKVVKHLDKNVYGLALTDHNFVAPVICPRF